MPKWLNTRGYPSLAIGICGRCSTKVPHATLRPDPNYPGLLVCGSVKRGCIDEYDPYRLSARTPEEIAIRNARPDISIVVEGGVPPPLPPS